MLADTYLLVAGIVGVGIWLWSVDEIDLISLVFVAVGLLLGYIIGVDLGARRRSAALLRSLSRKMSQLAGSTASGAAESEAEEMFTLGQAKAFELVATELDTMADKIG